MSNSAGAFPKHSARTDKVSNVTFALPASISHMCVCETPVARDNARCDRPASWRAVLRFRAKACRRASWPRFSASFLAGAFRFLSGTLGSLLTRKQYQVGRYMQSTLWWVARSRSPVREYGPLPGGPTGSGVYRQRLPAPNPRRQRVDVPMAI